jgi:hypothetical protein
MEITKPVLVPLLFLVIFASCFVSFLFGEKQGKEVEYHAMEPIVSQVMDMVQGSIETNATLRTDLNRCMLNKQ